MAKAEFCQLWLTCKDTVEADTIARDLLNARLVACVKQVPVSSMYHWKGGLEHDSEVLLVMDSRLDLFEQAEAAITKLHSYETFVLQCVPLAAVSKNAQIWLNKVLTDKDT